MEEVKRGEGLNFSFRKFADAKCMVSAKRKEYHVNHKPDQHCHDFPQVWYTFRGSHTHWVNGETYQCGEGSLMIVPPGTAHNLLSFEEITDMVEMNIAHEILFNIPFEDWRNTLSNLCLPLFSDELKYTFPRHILLTGESKEKVEEVLSWLCLLRYAPDGSYTDAQICEKTEELFSIPELRVPEEYHKKACHIFQTRCAPILRTLRYLNIHYPERITEEALLKEAGISRRGMFRYFPRFTNCTYGIYLQRLRTWRANVYLRETNYSLSYISDVCGFCDVQYMSRIFQKYIGVTPKNRRNQLEELRRAKQSGKEINKCL